MRTGTPRARVDDDSRSLGSARRAERNSGRRVHGLDARYPLNAATATEGCYQSGQHTARAYSYPPTRSAGPHWVSTSGAGMYRSEVVKSRGEEDEAGGDSESPGEDAEERFQSLGLVPFDGGVPVGGDSGRDAPAPSRMPNPNIQNITIDSEPSMNERSVQYSPRRRGGLGQDERGTDLWGSCRSPVVVAVIFQVLRVYAVGIGYVCPAPGPVQRWRCTAEPNWRAWCAGQASMGVRSPHATGEPPRVISMRRGFARSVTGRITLRTPLS